MGLHRSAVESRPTARSDIDAELTRAYRGKADELLAEIEDLLGHFRSESCP
jgi:hypothetical protein